MRKMRNSYGKTWIMVKNTEKRAKCEIHTVVPGIWRETLKNVKNEYCTLQNLEYGKKTDQKGKSVIHMVDLVYGEKHRKKCKMRNPLCRNWDIVINSEKREK